MNLVSRPTLFSAAVELLPHVVEGPLGDLSEEEEAQAVQKAARLARLLAKEFSEGPWAPTIEPLPLPDIPTTQDGPTTTEKNPEWIRMPTKGKCPYTGLSRSYLYNLVGANASNGYRPPVKSIVLRRRGAARGVRLRRGQSQFHGSDREYQNGRKRKLQLPCLADHCGPSGVPEFHVLSSWISSSEPRKNKKPL